MSTSATSGPLPGICALQGKLHAHKHGRMGRNRTPLRACLATLCAALAVVFAGASASSVVDRIQHEAHVPHGHHFSLSFETDDDHHADEVGHHHHDDGDAGDHHGDAGDHQAAAGHHHADAPTGALSFTSAAVLTPVVVAVSVPLTGPPNLRGVRPGGLDRPPKPIAQLV